MITVKYYTQKQARCSHCGRFARQAGNNTWRSASGLMSRTGTMPISACCGDAVLRPLVKVPA